MGFFTSFSLATRLFIEAGFWERQQALRVIMINWDNFPVFNAYDYAKLRNPM